MDEEAVSRPAKRGLRVTWRGIVVAVVAVVFLVFALQNGSSVRVQFLGFAVDVPVWVLAIGVFALGLLVGGVLVAGIARRRRLR